MTDSIILTNSEKSQMLSGKKVAVSKEMLNLNKMDYLKLPKEFKYNVLLELDENDLNALCQTHSSVKEICDDPKFNREWILKHGKFPYLIHDNGGRPFKVDFENNILKVYKLDEEAMEGVEVNQNSDIIYEEEPVLEIENPEKIFIGKSPKNKMTEFSGGYGPDFDGNSILVKGKDNEYIYIGATIISFEPLDKIIKFVSPVGNNDVPYSYAIDNSGNYYLFIYDIILTKIENFKDDPYGYFYLYHDITRLRNKKAMSDSLINKIQYFFYPKPVFQGITEFHIIENGEDIQYFMDFNQNPEKDYDRLMEDAEEMYIIQNGRKKILDKAGYVKIIEDYGEKMGFKPLESEIIVERLW